jgi:hypothetical protein
MLWRMIFRLLLLFWQLLRYAPLLREKISRELAADDNKYTAGSIDNARNHISGLREIMAAHGGTVGAPADHHLSFGIVKLLG